MWQVMFFGWHKIAHVVLKAGADAFEHHMATLAGPGDVSAAIIPEPDAVLLA